MSHQQATSRQATSTHSQSHMSSPHSCTSEEAAQLTQACYHPREDTRQGRRQGIDMEAMGLLGIASRRSSMWNQRRELLTMVV